MALDYKVFLSLGGFQEAIKDSDKRYNSHLLIDSNGDIVANYRPTHLYDVDLAKHVPGGVSIKESNYIEFGDKIVAPITSQNCETWSFPFSLGLTICYDLRFPEIYRLLNPCDVVLVPSAFMVKTG